MGPDRAPTLGWRILFFMIGLMLALCWLMLAILGAMLAPLGALGPHLVAKLLQDGAKMAQHSPT